MRALLDIWSVEQKHPVLASSFKLAYQAKAEKRKCKKA
jgi:hypothetical protein